MADPEKPKAWWAENEGTRRAVAISSILTLILPVALLWSDIKDFLSVHPWWQSFIAALPGIALVILAYFEFRHSGEANSLRTEANRLRTEANSLQHRIADLEAERNEHLQQIAANTRRPVTRAETNAAVLRKHLRASVTVSEGKMNWGVTPEVVEISDDNIVTLFAGRSSSQAWCVQVHCDDLEITEIPQGSCPLRVRVLKRYGADVQLGEITKWDDRSKPAATPVFAKGGVVRHATYSKPGSSETRSIHVFMSNDGANSFLLEASTGEKTVGDNVEISKRFLVLQVEYEAAGFNCTQAGTGGGPYPLFIH
jgi:hypothetical protein